MAGELPASIVGRRLGAYVVIELLGAGGMGKVYRARDTKLDRDVAIKVLPSILAADNERLVRFRREARLLAAVSHPHIGAIFGIEESDGVPALVLELVEGPTLAERLASGPLPIKEALAVARQVAEALAAAHERGIIHRDLKPANIKFTREGAVKVLDFGLAKVIVGDTPERDRTPLPPLTDDTTCEGLVLGTVGYMSPEQATGRPTDKRTDIWAFGCVLFEMLAGQRAIQGKDLKGGMVAPFGHEPAWPALPPQVPVAIRRLIQRCLERDPRQRVADIAAALFVLDETDLPPIASVSSDPTSPPLATNPPPRAAAWRVTAISGVTLLIGAALTAGLMRLFTQAAAPTVARTMIATKSAAALTVDGVVGDVAVSPDGSRVVYTGNDGTQVFVRALDRLEPVAIATGHQPRNPFVSPDGQWVGFFEGVALKKVLISGGPSITVAEGIEGTGPRGATWASDDTIVVATNSGAGGLWLIPVGGGAPVLLTRPDRARGEAQHLWPERLPGGHSVLFTITSQTGGPDAAQIAVLDLRTRKEKVLLRGGSQAHYLTSGHLVYAAAGTLRAVPFDVGRLEVRGTNVQVVPRVLMTLQGTSDFTAVGDTLVYVDPPSDAVSGVRRMLTWVDRTGREQPIGAPPLSYVLGRLSPDGTRLALDIAGQERGLWIWDFQRATLTRLTMDAALNRIPEWTRDGKRIVYTSNRGGADNLWWQVADGTGVAERLLTSGNVQLASGTTPDGRAMVFTERMAGRGTDLMKLALDGSRQVTPVLETPANERNGIVSFDGRWIAYESDTSGNDEIYVRPFPNTNEGQWQVSVGGGTRPLWSRDGRELFYVVPAAGAPLMRVPVETRGATFHAAASVKLFEGYTAASPSRTYDLAADGRFVMIRPPARDQTEQPNLVVVQHWGEELKRLVPVK